MGLVRFGHLDTLALMGDDAVVRIYGLSVNGGDVFDVLLDRVEAEFALLDVIEDEPELANDLAVLEIEAASVRVVARAGRVGRRAWGADA